MSIQGASSALVIKLIQELQKLVQQFPILARLSIDSAGRLRIIIDAAGTATPVTKSGTWALDAGTAIIGYIGAGGVFPVDQRFELIQRANIEYEECQRRKMTIT